MMFGHLEKSLSHEEPRFHRHVRILETLGESGQMSIATVVDPALGLVHDRARAL